MKCSTQRGNHLLLLLRAQRRKGKRRQGNDFERAEQDRHLIIRTVYQSPARQGWGTTSLSAVLTLSLGRLRVLLVHGFKPCPVAANPVHPSHDQMLRVRSTVLNFDPAGRKACS